MGTTFSNVSLKEMAQRKSISCQETIRFILVRRHRSWKCPEAKTEREGGGTRSGTVWAGCPAIEPSVKEGMAPAPGGPWRREGSEQMRHGNGTETPAQTVQSELNLNSGYVRIVEEGCFLEVVRPVKLGRKEGSLLAEGAGLLRLASGQNCLRRLLKK